MITNVEYMGGKILKHRDRWKQKNRPQLLQLLSHVKYGRIFKA
jgi:hypothetical protein